jgi:hypothetical protein
VSQKNPVEMESRIELLQQEVRNLLQAINFREEPSPPTPVDMEPLLSNLTQELHKIYVMGHLTHQNQEQVLHQLASLSPILDLISQLPQTRQEQPNRLSKEEMETLASRVNQQVNAFFNKQHQLLNQIHSLVKPLKAPTIQLPSIPPWLLGVSFALHGLGVAALVIIFMQVVPPSQSLTMRQQWTAIFQRVDQLHKKLVGQQNQQKYPRQR